MFTNACKIARSFTCPVIISTRTLDGTCNASVGTMFLINDDGWAFMAGHSFDSFAKFQGDKNKIMEAEQINSNRKENPIQKDPKWITNHSFWFGKDNIRFSKVYINRQVDIALVKLEGVPPIDNYPVFRDPDTLLPGTSLCRMGFPLVKAVTEFNPENNSFSIKKGVLPLPFFPNDCIHTRNISRGAPCDGIDWLYVETSTPGLLGQSGGPIFDTKGRIYAMQVCTNSIPLGFHPSLEVEGKTVIENQFMNVGMGVHVKALIQVMRKSNIKFRSESDDGGETYIIN